MSSKFNQLNITIKDYQLLFGEQDTWIDFFSGVLKQVKRGLKIKELVKPPFKNYIIKKLWVILRIFWSKSDVKTDNCYYKSYWTNQLLAVKVLNQLDSCITHNAVVSTSLAVRNGLSVSLVSDVNINRATQ